MNTFAEACTILSQEDFANRLLAAGWTRVKCATCDGVGHFTRESGELFEGVAKAKSRRICEACSGRGETWSEGTK